MTRPDLMHWVQTLMRFSEPLPILARTSCRLGSQRLFVLLLAWLTLCPYIGLLPQTSQRFMISPDDQNIVLYLIITLILHRSGRYNNIIDPEMQGKYLLILYYNHGDTENTEKKAYEIVTL